MLLGQDMSPGIVLNLVLKLILVKINLSKKVEGLFGLLCAPFSVTRESEAPESEIRRSWNGLILVVFTN